MDDWLLGKKPPGLHVMSSHFFTKTCPCNIHCTENCLVVKMKLLTRQNDNFYSKHRLWGEAVLTSIHNLCFGAEIRKIGIPLHTPVLLYKSGV